MSGTLRTELTIVHPNQLDYPDDVLAYDDATEVLRAWIVKQGLNVSLKPVAFETIDTWGLLLVDVARHVARAWEAEGKGTFSSNLEAIDKMYEAEMKRPTDMGSTAKRQAN